MSRHTVPSSSLLLSLFLSLSLVRSSPALLLSHEKSEAFGESQPAGGITLFRNYLDAFGAHERVEKRTHVRTHARDVCSS